MLPENEFLSIDNFIPNHEIFKGHPIFSTENKQISVICDFNRELKSYVKPVKLENKR